MGALGATVLAGLAPSRALACCFPARRRFPELVAGRGAVALPSHSRGFRRSTWIGIAAVLAVGVAASVLVPLAGAHMEKEEAELESLRASVDDRSDDMAMRLNLDDQLSCATTCDAGKLEAHNELRNVAIDRYLTSAFDVPRRRSKRSTFLDE